MKKPKTPKTPKYPDGGKTKLDIINTDEKYIPYFRGDGRLLNAKDSAEFRNGYIMTNNDFNSDSPAAQDWAKQKAEVYGGNRYRNNPKDAFSLGNVAGWLDKGEAKDYTELNNLYKDELKRNPEKYNKIKIDTIISKYLHGESPEQKERIMRKLADYYKYGQKNVKQQDLDRAHPYGYVNAHGFTGSYSNGGLIKFAGGGNYAAMAQIGMMAGQGMGEMASNQNLQGQDKELANEATMNKAADQGIQMIPGFGQYYQVAKGASDFGRSMIGKDEQGYAHSNMEQAGDNLMNPTHQMITKNISKGQYGEAAASAVFNPAIGSVAGEVFKGTKFGDKMTAYGRGEKIFSEGGITNAWNNPNAELEKQENVVTPDGQFGQFNGPSHDNGGIPTNLPQGTKVFSDRLKMGKTGKTFAQLNKPNNTTKEDKIINDSKSTSVAKATASLMKLAKQKNSDELFAAQEALKQSKVDRYTMKLGGIVNYPDGGKTPYNQGFIPDTNYSGTNAVGFPVDKFGRKLTPEEMTGFSRPGYSYGKGTVAGASGSTGINPLTGHAYQPLANAGGVPRVTQLGALGTENPMYQQPTNMTTAQFIEYVNNKKAYGGTIKYDEGGLVYNPKTGKYESTLGQSPIGISGVTGGNKLQTIESDEPELIHPREFGYANFKDWNDLNQAEFGTPKTNGNSTNRGGIPWGDMLKQGALGIVNNLGNIYDLNRAKDVEKVTYGKLNPALPDETASLREADRQGRIGEYNLRNASVGNSGAYMANEVANRTNTTLTKDKIKREYENMRADIRNRAQEFNIGQQIGEDTVNRQIRGNARNITGNALSNIGTNVMGQYKDSQMTKADMDKIELIKTMYPAIKNNKEMMAYYKTKYPKFNWSEIERG